MLDIKPLPKSVQISLRSGQNIKNYAACITQLIYNSLDAKATSIAVRINLLSHKIQIIDNGSGITKFNLKLVGEPYMTNKYYSIKDEKKSKCCYGYRGETLFSIRQLCYGLTITSKASGSKNAYNKTFKEGQPFEIEKTERSCIGTTITIENFLYNNPVRQNYLETETVLTEIKNKLEKIVLIHPNTSFSLRNDANGEIISQIPKTKYVVKTFEYLYGTDFSKSLRKIYYKGNNISVGGLLGVEASIQIKIQEIFVNKRIVKKNKLHKFVNSILTKALKAPYQDKEISKREKNPIFILSITCSTLDIEIIDYTESVIEFKNYEIILSIVRTALEEILLKENLLPSEKSPPKNLEPLEIPKFDVTARPNVIQSKKVTRNCSNNKKSKMNLRKLNIKKEKKLFFGTKLGGGKSVIGSVKKRKLKGRKSVGKIGSEQNFPQGNSKGNFSGYNLEQNFTEYDSKRNLLDNFPLKENLVVTANGLKEKIDSVPAGTQIDSIPKSDTQINQKSKIQESNLGKDILLDIFLKSTAVYENKNDVMTVNTIKTNLKPILKLSTVYSENSNPKKIPERPQIDVSENIFPDRKNNSKTTNVNDKKFDNIEFDDFKIPKNSRAPKLTQNFVDSRVLDRNTVSSSVVGKKIIMDTFLKSTVIYKKDFDMNSLFPTPKMQNLSVVSKKSVSISIQNLREKKSVPSNDGHRSPFPVEREKVLAHAQKNGDYIWNRNLNHVLNENAQNLIHPNRAPQMQNYHNGHRPTFSDERENISANIQANPYYLANENLPKNILRNKNQIGPNRAHQIQNIYENNFPKCSTGYRPVHSNDKEEFLNWYQNNPRLFKKVQNPKRFKNGSVALKRAQRAQDIRKAIIHRGKYNQRLRSTHRVQVQKRLENGSKILKSVQRAKNNQMAQHIGRVKNVAKYGLHTVQNGLRTVQNSLHTVQNGIHTVQNGLHTAQNGLHTVQNGLYTAHTAQNGTHTIQNGHYTAQHSLHTAQNGLHRAHTAKNGLHTAQNGLHTVQNGLYTADSTQNGLHTVQNGLYTANTTQNGLHTAQNGLFIAQNGPEFNKNPKLFKNEPKNSGSSYDYFTENLHEKGPKHFNCEINHTNQNFFLRAGLDNFENMQATAPQYYRPLSNTETNLTYFQNSKDNLLGHNDPQTSYVDKKSFYQGYRNTHFKNGCRKTKKFHFSPKIGSVYRWNDIRDNVFENNAFDRRRNNFFDYTPYLIRKNKKHFILPTSESTFSHRSIVLFKKKSHRCCTKLNQNLKKLMRTNLELRKPSKRPKAIFVVQKHKIRPNPVQYGRHEQGIPLNDNFLPNTWQSHPNRNPKIPSDNKKNLNLGLRPSFVEYDRNTHHKPIPVEQENDLAPHKSFEIEPDLLIFEPKFCSTQKIGKDEPILVNQNWFMFSTNQKLSDGNKNFYFVPHSYKKVAKRHILNPENQIEAQGYEKLDKNQIGPLNKRVLDENTYGNFDFESKEYKKVTKTDILNRKNQIEAQGYEKLVKNQIGPLNDLEIDKKLNKRAPDENTYGNFDFESKGYKNVAKRDILNPKNQIEAQGYEKLVKNQIGPLNDLEIDKKLNRRAPDENTYGNFDFEAKGYKKVAKRDILNPKNQIETQGYEKMIKNQIGPLNDLEIDKKLNKRAPDENTYRNFDFEAKGYKKVAKRDILNPKNLIEAQGYEKLVKNQIGPLNKRVPDENTYGNFDFKAKEYKKLTKTDILNRKNQIEAKGYEKLVKNQIGPLNDLEIDKKLNKRAPDENTYGNFDFEAKGYKKVAKRDILNPNNQIEAHGYEKLGKNQIGPINNLEIDKKLSGRARKENKNFSITFSSLNTSKLLSRNVQLNLLDPFETSTYFLQHAPQSILNDLQSDKRLKSPQDLEKDPVGSKHSSESILLITLDDATPKNDFIFNQKNSVFDSSYSEKENIDTQLPKNTQIPHFEPKNVPSEPKLLNEKICFQTSVRSKKSRVKPQNNVGSQNNDSETNSNVFGAPKTSIGSRNVTEENKDRKLSKNTEISHFEHKNLKNKNFPSELKSLNEKICSQNLVRSKKSRGKPQNNVEPQNNDFETNSNVFGAPKTSNDSQNVLENHENHDSEQTRAPGTSKSCRSSINFLKSCSSIDVNNFLEVVYSNDENTKGIATESKNVSKILNELASKPKSSSKSKKNKFSLHVHNLELRENDTNNSETENFEQKFDDEWIEKKNTQGKDVLVNVRTGMSIFQKPSDNTFAITSRYVDMPKGMSPLIFATSKPSQELTPISKNVLYETMAKCGNDDVKTIKWLKYFKDKDAKSFFNNLYENMNYYQSDVPSLTKNSTKLSVEYKFTKDMFENLIVLNQLDKKFIVATYDDENERKILILFDQHAVDERIRLEKLLKHYKNGSNNSYKKVSCKNNFRIRLNNTELQMLRNSAVQKQFESWGIFYKNENQNSVLITHIPLFLQLKDDSYKSNLEESYIMQLLNYVIKEQDQILKTTGKINPILPLSLLNIIKYESCRGAIKFGDKLPPEKCVELIKNLSKCDLPFECAHGRPTLTIITNLSDIVIKEQESKINLKKIKLHESLKQLDKVQK